LPPDIVFGPQRREGYDAGYFPYIRDAVEVGAWADAQRWVEKAGDKIHEAGLKLVA